MVPLCESATSGPGAWPEVKQGQPAGWGGGCKEGELRETSDR